MLFVCMKGSLSYICIVDMGMVNTPMSCQNFAHEKWRSQTFRTGCFHAQSLGVFTSSSRKQK